MGNSGENLIVYQALRDEIIRAEESKANCAISMYVSFVALFSIGFSYNWIFLASFVVLIVFQAMINRDWWSITKLSAYIQVFFEDTRKDIHWESLHAFEGFKKLHSKQNKELSWVIFRWSSAFLAILSLVSLIAVTFGKSGLSISLLDIVILVCALFLCTVTIYTNKLLFKKSDDTELKECIKNYLNEMSKESESDN